MTPVTDAMVDAALDGWLGHPGWRNQLSYATASRRYMRAALTAALATETVRNEWWIVFDTLREAQKRMEKDGIRSSWMDGAIGIAKERAGV